MITVQYEPDRFTLKISGHAGYAEQGKDIVCAAVSTLGQTLILCIQGYSTAMVQEPVIDLSDGLIVSCMPTEERKREVALLYWFAVCGLDALAEQYPDNISIKIC